jgi:hypothetical protein
MVPERNIPDGHPTATKETTATTPPAGDTSAEPLNQQTPDNNTTPHDAADTKTSPKLPPGAVLPKPTAAVASAAAGKPATAPKPPDKPLTPPAPFEPQPSLPVSMILRPDSAGGGTTPGLFPGELEESFESALARVEPERTSAPVGVHSSGRIREFISAVISRKRKPAPVQRMVAFDGFRNDLFEEKRERDRRYGTVYTVVEEANAFLVRLELPRKMPNSALKHAWQLPDEMPDYVCTLSLADNVLSIRAGLPDEARRRVSYISSSFPSDFQTRIEFHTPVAQYRHRLRNKVLEVIVYKKS